MPELMVLSMMSSFFLFALYSALSVRLIFSVCSRDAFMMWLLMASQVPRQSVPPALCVSRVRMMSFASWLLKARSS